MSYLWPYICHDDHIYIYNMTIYVSYMPLMITDESYKSIHAKCGHIRAIYGYIWLMVVTYGLCTIYGSINVTLSLFMTYTIIYVSYMLHMCHISHIYVRYAAYVPYKPHMVT